jgi:hypothetical protein
MAGFDSRRLMPPSLATQPDEVALNAFGFLRAAPMPLWTSMMPKRLRHVDFRESAHRATFARMLLDGVAGVGNAAVPAVRAAARAALVELFLSTRMFACNTLEIECWLLVLRDAPAAAIDAIELAARQRVSPRGAGGVGASDPSARDERRQARTLCAERVCVGAMPTRDSPSCRSRALLLSALHALRDGVADEATRNVLLDVVQLAFGTQLTPLPLAAAIVVHGSPRSLAAAATTLGRRARCASRCSRASRCRHCSQSRTRNAPRLASRCPSCAAARRALTARCRRRCSVLFCAATPWCHRWTLPRWPAPRPFSCVWRRLVRDVERRSSSACTRPTRHRCVAQPH